MNTHYLSPRFLQQVAEFHKMTNNPVLETPTIPSKERCELRKALIQEELNELSEAIENKDMVEIADALADILYVVGGTIHEFGLGTKINDIFNEVHRSNMTKGCKSMEEARQTQQHYWEKRHTSTYIQPFGDYFLVVRESDNKTLKSINYSKADIKPLIGI